MQISLFNLRVPLPNEEVFLMNTLSDAQLVVSADVAALLDRVGTGDCHRTEDERDAFSVLAENGFIVEGREAERQALDDYLRDVKADASELHVTLLTTLQCNFACDYCFQGDHGDYNKFAEKMSLETASRVGRGAWGGGGFARNRPVAVRARVGGAGGARRFGGNEHQGAGSDGVRQGDREYTGGMRRARA